MLILLGLELTRVKWSHSIRAMSLGVFIRLASHTVGNEIVVFARNLSPRYWMVAPRAPVEPPGTDSAGVAGGRSPRLPEGAEPPSRKAA